MLCICGNTGSEIKKEDVLVIPLLESYCLDILISLVEVCRDLGYMELAGAKESG